MSEVTVPQDQDNLGKSGVGDIHRYDTDDVIRGDFSGGDQVVIDSGIIDQSPTFDGSVCIELMAEMTVLLADIYNIPVCQVIEAVERYVIDSC